MRSRPPGRVKEQLLRLLRAGDLADANHQWLLLAQYVDVAAMPETTRFLATVNAWWDAIEILVVTGVTNARTEAANTRIKHLKRTGRGYRTPVGVARTAAMGEAKVDAGTSTAGVPHFSVSVWPPTSGGY